MSPQELENSEMKILKGKSGFLLDPLKRKKDSNQMPVGEPLGSGVPAPDEALAQQKKEDPENKDFPNGDVALQEEG